MAIKDGPHYILPATELARWLRRQGDNSWWLVDGDSRLTGWLDFPCTAEELANMLDRINRPLLLAAQGPLEGTGTAGADDLDLLVGSADSYFDTEGNKERFFYLCWQDRDEDWALLEDLDTAEYYRKDLLQQEGP